MARNSPKKASRPEVGLPSIAPERAIDLLGRQIVAGNSLFDDSNLTAAKYNDWRVGTEDCVSRAFGLNTERYNEFLYASPPSSVTYYDIGPTAQEEIQNRRQLLRHKIDSLSSLSKLLVLDIELNAESRLSSPPAAQPDNKSVFIVHGHDHAALHSVARFIGLLGLTPIILHELPNRGQTIIEKFVTSSKVGFAIVLLTPDDVGRSAEVDGSHEKPRARQNVILELGYFLGAIGRPRVCPLCVPGVEIPSDYDGVVYTPLDSNGAWKLMLARELKAAEFAVDLNNAM